MCACVHVCVHAHVLKWSVCVHVCVFMCSLCVHVCERSVCLCICAHVLNWSVCVHVCTCACLVLVRVSVFLACTSSSSWKLSKLFMYVNDHQNSKKTQPFSNDRRWQEPKKWETSCAFAYRGRRTFYVTFCTVENTALTQCSPQQSAREYLSLFRRCLRGFPEFRKKYTILSWDPAKDLLTWKWRFSISSIWEDTGFLSNWGDFVFLKF